MHVHLKWYFRVCLSFFLLVITDIVMTSGGFPALHTMLWRWRCESSVMPPQELLDECLSAVDAAMLLYVKTVKCLQSAAVIVCLLRCSGIPAQLVIGVRCSPFFAHAWVELRGTVIAGTRDRSQYLVIDRV